MALKTKTGAVVGIRDPNVFVIGEALSVLAYVMGINQT